MPTEPQLLTPQANPEHFLLTDDYIKSITTRLEQPRARNPLVSEYGVAADYLSEVLDHLAAREQQFAYYQQKVKAELRGLLRSESAGAGTIIGIAFCEAAKQQNKNLNAAAARLGLSLTE